MVSVKKTLKNADNIPIFLPVDRSFGIPPANKLDMFRVPPLFLGASAAGLAPPPL